MLDGRLVGPLSNFLLRRLVRELIRGGSNPGIRHRMAGTLDRATLVGREQWTRVEGIGR